MSSELECVVPPQVRQVRKLAGRKGGISQVVSRIHVEIAIGIVMGDNPLEHMEFRPAIVVVDRSLGHSSCWALFSYASGSVGDNSKVTLQGVP